jgi:hypothetical protein
MTIENNTTNDDTQQTNNVATKDISSKADVSADSLNVKGQEDATAETTGTKDINPLINDVETKIEPIPEEEKKNIKKEIEYVDFTMPEDVEIDKDAIELFKPIAKKLNLSQEQAQELIDIQTQLIKKEELKRNEEYESAIKIMQEETKQMLGINYKKEMSYAAVAIDTIVSKEDKAGLLDFLTTSGAGNNMYLVKFFIEAGKKISEDKFIEGDKTMAEKSPEQIMFGELSKKLNNKK